MGLFSWLFGNTSNQEGGTDPRNELSFDELTTKYRQGWGDPHQQFVLLDRASAIAKGNLAQEVEVNSYVNEWLEKYGDQR